MARLGHNDIESVSQALLSLYSPGSYADFPARVNEILRRCFSFDSLAYHEIVDNQNRRTLSFPKSRLICRLLKPIWTNIRTGTHLPGTISSPP
jgi:hypothetical protein